MSDEEAMEFLAALDAAANQLFITSTEERDASLMHCTPQQIDKYWQKSIFDVAT